MRTIIFIILCFIYFSSNAATYYFSSTDGNDSYTSVQAQNPATPWQTITKLNSFFSSLSAGDNILFKRSDTFYGGIISNKNGTLGNEITIGAYGSGAKPIITGLTAVSSWTDLGGGIYESNALAASSVVRMVLIDGIEYAMGRTPNADATNGGYLNFESFTGSSITDNTNPFTNTITGATLVTRTQHPIIDQMTVSSVSGNTINYTGSTTGTLINGYGYFIENHLLTLDQYGEWYYNPSTNKISVYFGGSGPATTQVATQDILMSLPHSYLVVDGLHLYGANTYGIYCTNSGTNLLVNNCTIDFTGIDGVSMAGKQNFILDSSIINYANSCGVSVGFANVNPIVRNSTIKNIATFNGMLFKDDRLRYGFGIYSNEGLTATNNVLTNMGANGINCEGSDNLMQYNFVDTFGVVLDDVGGLYMYNHNPGGGAPVVTNNQILDNIVLHGIGDPYGTTSSTYRPAEGIYLDNNVTNVTVARNTAAYCADYGLYLHNDSAYTIRENVFFDNGSSQIGFQQDATNPSFDFDNGIVNRNQLFSIDDSKILYLASDNDNMFSFADLDSNWYCRPLNESNIIQTNWFNNATTNYNLASWQSASGHDANTLQSPVAITSEDDVNFLYNETTADKAFDLGIYNYTSVTGTEHANSITLEPFTSTILLKTGVNDTTIIITPYACDSTVTTELPEYIYIYGYDTTVLEGEDFTAYYNNQHYAEVIGDVTVITPLYDTIPAHDTTYVCSLCATCYDTSYVISLPILVVRANNQSKTYGQLFSFTNTGTQISIVSGGLVAGDVITTDNAASTGAVATATVGSYPVTLSSITIMRGATNVTSSYTITYQDGSLTVGQRPITITADNQGKTAGQTFTFTHTGSQVDVTSGSLASGDAITFDNLASNGSPSSAAAGTYPITLSSVIIAKGATNVTSSYSITYVAGTMTVTAAPAIITVRARNQVKTYGSTFTFLNNGSQVTVTSGSLIAGDVITTDNAASTGSGSSATVGNYAITLSSVTIMRGATDVTGSYTITYQPGTLTVNPVSISVQANNQIKTEGETFTFTNNGTQVSVVAGSLLSGHAITVDNAASSGSGSGAAAGNYTITLSAVTIMSGATNVTANYSISYQNGVLTVMAVNPEQVINGMLPNYDQDPPLPTLAQKISYVLSYSNNAYRSAFDLESTGWQTTQIKNAGLINMLTYNTSPVQAPTDAFVTAAQLPAAVASLDSVLTAHAGDLPQHIAFQNEEPNFNYWSGPVTDYINWLNAATTVAHNHGIKVSNGGLLMNIIYYVRWVYQQEGNTAMVNEINTRGLLWPGTGPAQQTYIDWYKIEIPALAASSIDYINQHWYEPIFTFKQQYPNSDTTTGLLPIVIQFLQERTGKTVITDEFGTDNASQALFNQMADEWNDNGVKIRIYYAGDGPVAELHPQYWEDWINQNSP